MAVQLEWAGSARGGGLAAPRLPDALLIALGGGRVPRWHRRGLGGSYGLNRQLLLPGEPVELLVGWSFIGSGLASWRAGPRPGSAR